MTKYAHCYWPSGNVSILKIAYQNLLLLKAVFYHLCTCCTYCWIYNNFTKLFIKMLSIQGEMMCFLSLDTTYHIVCKSLTTKVLLILKVQRKLQL